MLNDNHQKKSPEEIKAALLIKRITMKSIADDLGVTPPCVYLVVGGRGTSHRVQQAVADKLGLPFEQVWGHPTRTRRAA